MTSFTVSKDRKCNEYFQLIKYNPLENWLIYEIYLVLCYLLSIRQWNQAFKTEE